jgi:MFS family permease
MKRSPLIILFITVVIDLLGFGIIFPLLPLYVKHFHGSPVTAGLLQTSFSVMQFLFAPIWGRASDLWGRRPLILLGLLGTALSFLIYGLATSLWMLFAARIAAGILTAASLPTAQAYVADVMPPERRSRGMAMIGVAFGVGFATGPWIGGKLGHVDLALPAFFVAGMAFLNFVWSFFALPESHMTDRDASHARRVVIFDASRFARAFHNATLGELLTVFTISTFAFSMMEATFTWLVLLRFVEPNASTHLARAMLEEKTAATVGPIFGVVGIAAVLSQGAVMGGLAQRVGERQLIRAGAFILTLTLLGVGGAGSLGLITALAAFLAIGNGIMTPPLSSLVSKAAASDERGGVIGVQQGLGSFARMIAPPLGTWLLQRFTPGTPYFLAALLMGVAFLLSLNLKAAPLGEAVPPASLGH